RVGDVVPQIVAAIDAAYHQPRPSLGLQDGVDPQVDAVGRGPLHDEVPGAALVEPQRIVERQGMTLAALLAVGRDDPDGPDLRDALLQRLQTLGPVTVVVGDQDADGLHGPRSPGDRPPKGGPLRSGAGRGTRGPCPAPEPAGLAWIGRGDWI